MIKKEGEIDIKIGDLGNVLKLLGNVYDDPRDALAEFVTNGMDADANEIYIDLHRRGKNPYILISDNGNGMNKKELERVAQNVGNSIKKSINNPDIVGEKGIGILGFINFGRSVKIKSSAGKDKTYSLEFEEGSTIAKIKEDEYGRPIYGLHGTDVYVYGLHEDKSRIFTLTRLNEYLNRKFIGPLRARRFDLKIKEYTKTISVRPDEYKGEPFNIRTVEAYPYGNVKLSIYIVPPEWRQPTKISLYRKGILVVDDITDLTEFQKEPWTNSRIQGEISFNALDITSGRSGIIRDEKKFPVFLDAMSRIEPEVNKFIEEKSKELERQRDQGIYKKLNQAISKALRELKSESPTVSIESETGEEIQGESGMIKGAGSDKIGKGSGGGKRIIRPSDDEEKRTRRREGRGYNWEEEPFYDEYQHLRSRFDGNLNLIKINKIHPDYTSETQTRDRKLRYLSKLIVKEIALYDNPQVKPDNLLEKMIELQIHVERHIKS